MTVISVLARCGGLYLLAAGWLLLFAPQRVRGVIAVFAPGRRLYAVGALRAAIGLVFIAYAPASRIPWFMAVLGLAAVAIGALYFFLGLERLKAMVGTWDARPKNVIRSWGFLIFAAGILVVFFA